MTNISIVGINSSSGQHHSNITNSDLTTAWVDNRRDAWVQMAFAAVEQVSDINIIFGDFGTVSYLYSVGVSNDGVNFTHIISGSSKTNKKITNVYVGKPAQYVRVTIHENDSASQTKAAVVFLEAIRDDNTPPAPTPQPTPTPTPVPSGDTDKFGVLNFRKKSFGGIECYQNDPTWFDHYEKHGYKSIPGLKVYRKECGFIKKPKTVNVEVKCYVRVSHLLQSFWKLQKSGKGKDIGDGLSIKSIGNPHNDKPDSAGCYISHFPYLGGNKKNCQKEKPHPDYAKITVPTEFDLQRWAETAGDTFCGFGQIVELISNSTVRITAMVDTGGITAEGKPANQWRKWYSIVDNKQIGNAEAPQCIPVFTQPNGPLTQFRMDNVAKTTEIMFASVREVIPEP